MAITAQNVQWFGQPTTGQQNSFVYGFPNTPAQGQIPSQGGLSGSQSKVLTGIATFTGDGATTTATLNWIDGVQKPFTSTVTIPVLSVTAPATIGGVANQAVYSGVGAYGQLKVGQSVTFAGFTNGGNNGTFTINALTTSTIQVTNASSVAETNPAATVAATPLWAALVAGAVVARSIVSFAGVADTAASSITVSIASQSQTGGTITFSAAPANGALCSVLVQLYPNQ